VYWAGTLQIHCKDMDKVPTIYWDWDHCDWNDGDIQNVLLGKFSVTLFWLILNFTDSEHCDRTDGNTAKDTVNEPLGNIIGTFFGKIPPLSYPGHPGHMTWYTVNVLAVFCG